MDVSVRLRWLIVDCRDPELLASFWARLLGRTVGDRTGPYVELRSIRPDEPHLLFQRVTEPKTSKNRLHPDLVCADLAAARERVEALGGQAVPGYEAGGFLVMADPEGNEFCLLPDGPLNMDQEGNVHYPHPPSTRAGH